MSSIQPPSQNRPKDPYKYKVEETQDRQNKEEFSQDTVPPHVKRSAIFSYLLILFYKLLNLFESKSHEGLSPEEELEIKNDLSVFKTALLLLQREDRSQDSFFLNQLSKLWQIVLKDHTRFQKKTPLAAQFDDLIMEMQSYPQTQDHTFGYYLNECTGQKWLPFPYMEMVQTIHLHSQRDPASSPLVRWISQIEDIMNSLAISKN